MSYGTDIGDMYRQVGIYAGKVVLATPALAKPPVHHDHPQRPPVLSTFNGVSPIGGRIGPDVDPSIRAQILRDLPDAGLN
jgi:hypothetical protein